MPGQSHWGFKDSWVKDGALVKAWSNACTCKQHFTLPVTADFRSVFLALFLILTRSSEPMLPEQVRQGLADLSCTFRLKCIKCIWELHDCLQQIHFYLKGSKECFWVDSAFSITSESWSEMSCSTRQYIAFSFRYNTLNVHYSSRLSKRDLHFWGI